MTTVSTSEPNPLVKQLLEDIEFFGGRNKANFLHICTEKPGFYGAKGSNVRRRYHYAVDRLRHRKTGVEYKKFVEANGVAPSAATIADANMEELREEMTKVKVDEKKTSSKTKTAATAKATASDKATGEADDKDAKVHFSARDRSKTPPRTMTPPKGVLSAGFMSPDAASVTSLTDDTETGVDEKTLFGIDANLGWTSDNPHIIPVTRGTTILPHGFSSMVAENVEIGPHERDIYYLLKTIGGDLDKWKAMRPPIGEFPEYDNRCILVSGPGLDYIHSDKKTLTDSLTATLQLQRNPIPPSIANGLKRSIKKLASFFTRTPAKHVQHYLFIYPPGVVFDNSAISGTGSADNIKAYGIRINSKFSIFSKKEHSNMVCFWAIATEADEEDRTDDFASGLASDIYDF